MLSHETFKTNYATFLQFLCYTSKFVSVPSLLKKQIYPRNKNANKFKIV